MGFTMPSKPNDSVQFQAILGIEPDKQEMIISRLY